MKEPTTEPQNQSNYFNLHYFDLETAALPLEKLEPRMPEFTAPMGWKDAEKIQAEIDRKKQAWLEDCALSPLTGQILAAVWVEPDGNYTIYDSDQEGEGSVISQIFNRFSEAGRGSHYKIAGFNIREFDLPFLFKRAFALNRRIPPGILNARSKWFDLPSWLIDLRDLWSMGEKFAPGSLGVIAEFLGVGSKSGSGKDFERLWRDPVFHADALAYLIGDGLHTRSVAERLLSTSPDQFGLNLNRIVSKPKTKDHSETRVSGKDSSENPPEEDQIMD